MKVKMLLFPSYVSLASARDYSPQLFRFLRERGVELEADEWDGTTNSIPQEGLVIVRASTKMRCDSVTLGRVCEALGHFVFYDDRVLLGNGEYSHDQLLGNAQEFIDNLIANDELVDVGEDWWCNHRGWKSKLRGHIVCPGVVFFAKNIDTELEEW